MNLGHYSRKLMRMLRSSRQKLELQQVERILLRDENPVTERAESLFEQLQSAFQPLPEYGYDPVSVFRRAVDRTSDLLKLDQLVSPGAKGLDVGAGDGMLPMLLQTYGHDMTLIDVEDWRVEVAKGLKFVKANCCNQLPFVDGTFDFIVSYNAFEHFPDPSRAFSEFIRILRPGGLMHFRFNPLYCSPWGLHAYRMLRMPYPQFLFSKEFIEKRLKITGVWDLGKQSSQLQPLNQWRPAQFESLWQRSDLTILTNEWQVDVGHLNMIRQYPECFQGRGLTIEDLTKAGSIVTLLKV